jgi:hypothetical protein
MGRIVDLDATSTSPQEFEGVILVCDFLDSVHGLDNMMRVAEEMLIACALIIAREVGADEARDALKLAGASVR